MKTTVAAALLVCLLLAGASPARAEFFTGLQYEMSVSGTFADHLLQGNPATYPFPALYRGSFAGSFIYDPLNKLPWTAEVDIMDGAGSVVSQISDSKIDLTPLSTIGEAFPRNALRLAFGESFGVALGLQDLRIFLAGDFVPGQVPGPQQILDGDLAVGFIETDSNLTSGEGWDLLIEHASVQLTRTNEYQYLVPEPGMLALLISGLMGVRAIVWCTARRYREPSHHGTRFDGA